MKQKMEITHFLEDLKHSDCDFTGKLCYSNVQKFDVLLLWRVLGA